MVCFSIKNETPDKSLSFRLKMFSLGFIPILSVMMTGFAQVYTSVALPQMKLNIDEASWFSAIINVASFIGAILNSVIIDIYGRKTALMTGTLPHIFGWMLIYCNYNKLIIFIGRTLTGFSMQSQIYSARVYLIECVAVNKIRFRSFLLTLVSVSINFGSLLIYVLSYFLNHLHLAAFVSFFSLILLLLIFIILPESPTWLYLQNRRGDAELAKRRLNISEYLLQKIRVIKSNTNNSLVLERNNPSFGNFCSGIKKITRKDVYKPIIIMSIVVSLGVATGGFAFIAYMIDIIDSGKSQNLLTEAVVADNITENESFAYALISTIIGIAALMVQSALLPLFGARTITMVASCFMFVGLCILGLIDAADMGNGNLFLWHVATVWFIIFTFHLGVYAVPCTIIGEIFPADAKGMAGIPVCIMIIVMGIILKLHPYLYLWCGIYQYYIYAAVAATETIFVFFFMPETVGKTLEQINRELLCS